MTKFHSEAVNAPSHYAGDIECIDAMVQQFGAEDVKTACVVQAFEMLWRWKAKGDADENLHKAHWWLSYALGDDPRDRDKDDHAPESASGYAVKTSREWDLQTGREVKSDAN